MHLTEEPYYWWLYSRFPFPPKQTDSRNWWRLPFHWRTATLRYYQTRMVRKPRFQGHTFHKPRSLIYPRLCHYKNKTKLITLPPDSYTKILSILPLNRGTEGSQTMDRKWMTADPLEYELLKENAKKNRQNATEAESVFWSMVKPKTVIRTFYFIFLWLLAVFCFL